MAECFYKILVGIALRNMIEGCRENSLVTSNVLIILKIMTMLYRFSVISFLLFSYVWYAMLPYLILQRFSMSTGFLAVNVLLNNSADAEYMGLVNGLGMLSSSVSR